MFRSSNVVWHGSITEGSGVISTQSGAFKEQPYSIKTRFASEDGKAGTNPEELLGAAHAACFSMALSAQLTGAGHPPDELKTEAKVELIKLDAGWSVPSIKLTVVGKVPGIDAAKFQELAGIAKANCPISKALSVTITLDATLG